MLSFKKDKKYKSAIKTILGIAILWHRKNIGIGIEPIHFVEVSEYYNTHSIGTGRQKRAGKADVRIPNSMQPTSTVRPTGQTIKAKAVMRTVRVSGGSRTLPLNTEEK